MMTVEELKRKTDEELCALTEEMIEKIVMYNVADRGIQLVQKPTLIEEVSAMSPTNRFLQCKEIFGSLLFPDMDSYQKAMELLRTLHIKKLSGHYKYNANVFTSATVDDYGNDTVGIKEVEAYSVEEYDSVSDLVKANTEIKKKNEYASKMYDKFMSEVSDVRMDIMGIISDAKERSYELETAERLFKTYMDLAEGNYGIAMRFYVKAEGGDRRLVSHIEKLYGKDVEVAE
jgi:hypothetical protein